MAGPPHHTDEVCRFRGPGGNKRRVIEKRKNGVRNVFILQKATISGQSGMNEHGWKDEEKLGRKLEI